MTLISAMKKGEVDLGTGLDTEADQRIEKVTGVGQRTNLVEIENMLPLTET